MGDLAIGYLSWIPVLNRVPLQRVSKPKFPRHFIDSARNETPNIPRFRVANLGQVDLQVAVVASGLSSADSSFALIAATKGFAARHVSFRPFEAHGFPGRLQAFGIGERSYFGDAHDPTCSHCLY